MGITCNLIVRAFWWTELAIRWIYGYFCLFPLLLLFWLPLAHRTQCFNVGKPSKDRILLALVSPWWVPFVSFKPRYMVVGFFLSSCHLQVTIGRIPCHFHFRFYNNRHTAVFLFSSDLFLFFSRAGRCLFDTDFCLLLLLHCTDCSLQPCKSCSESRC